MIARDGRETIDVYEHIPHPHTIERLEHRDRPAQTRDGLDRSTRLKRLNSWLAVQITRGFGTMACSYVFAVIALCSLPAILIEAGALHQNDVPHFFTKPGLILIVAWIAQTFLQLVLLSIIIVGQNIAAKASDKRADATYKDAESILSEALEIQKHLQAQDEKLITALHEALTRNAT
ncbi:MAG: hypothetical protein ABSA31_00880 [Acidimicrobiales bacterium]|jgi:hypothetical protein